MTTIGVSSLVAFLLATAPVPSSPVAASVQRVAGPSEHQRQSPSWWLETGEQRQRAGDFAGAGEAYRQAFSTLSAEKQKANEGARASILAAEAYWLAFEADSNPAHLQSAFEVLDGWLTLVGPQGRATLRGDVERMVAQVRAVRDPLLEADAALDQEDLGVASERYDDAANALEAQQRPWPTAARLALRIATAHVSAYDGHVASVQDIEANRPLLESAAQTLRAAQARRPADDQSPEAEQIATQLADVERRLAEADTELAAARAEAERQAKPQPEPTPTKPPAETEEPPPGRVLPIVLLSTGIAATAAGVGLLTEGVVFGNVSDRREQSAITQADDLQQMLGGGFDRSGFDADLADYRDQVRRRNLGMMVGGGVLLAGGVAATVAGAVLLAKRRRTAPRAAARVWPSVSPTHVQLTLGARF